MVTIKIAFTVFVLLLHCWKAGAQGCSLVVTTITDGGAGSLREAINCANASPDFSTITFNIDGGGAKTLIIDNYLPNPSTPLLIDGSSQPGYDAVSKLPLIKISANPNPQLYSAFTMSPGSEGSEIRGLYITDFQTTGIQVLTDNITIRNNVINHLRSPSTNAIPCIYFKNAGSNSKVLGNTFGTDATGQNFTIYPNNQSLVGIFILASVASVHDIQIGSAIPGEGNKFAYLNDGVGLSGANVINVSVIGNTFSSIPDANIYTVSGITQTSAVPTGLGNTTTALTGTAAAGNTIHIYKSNQTKIDAVAYIGSTTANPSGAWTFDFSSYGGMPPTGTVLVLTATSPTASTSSFIDYTIVNAAAIVQPVLSLCERKKTLLAVDNLRANVVAYYPFNGNARDESGNNNHAYALGAQLATDAYGNPNSAYKINGNNGEAVRAFIQYTGSNGSYVNFLTLSYWFKGTDITGAYTTSWFNSGVGNPPTHVVTTSTTVGGNIYDGNWHHIAVTWSSNTGAGQKSFVDGVMVSSANTVNQASLIASPGIMSCKDGYMDEFVMYDRVLTASEIVALGKKYKWTNDAGLMLNAGPFLPIVPFSSASHNYTASRINDPQPQEYVIAYTIAAPQASTVLPSKSVCQGETSIVGVGSLASSVVAYYPLNGNAKDESGKKNHGYYTNPAYVPDRFCNPNGAAQIKGQTQSIKLNISTTGNLQALSVSFWFKGTDISNVFTGNNFSSGVNQAGLKHRIGYYYLSMGNNFYDNAWHHFAITWTNNGGPQGNRSYLDGVLVDYSLSVNGAQYAFSQLAVACENGYLDDVVLYDKMLSRDEVLMLASDYTWSGSAQLNFTKGPLVSGKFTSATDLLVNNSLGSGSYCGGDISNNCIGSYTQHIDVTVPPTTPLPAKIMCKGDKSLLYVNSLNTNLLAYYPMNNNANDESGNKRDGVFTNPAFTTDRFQNANSAASIHGATQFIKAPLDVGHFLQGFTLSYWFKGTNVSNAINTGNVFSGLGTSTLTHNVNGYVTKMGDNIQDDQWHHIAVTWVNNGGTLGNKSFLDGVLVDYSQSVNGAMRNFAFLTISCENGSMDDIAVYERALGADEIILLKGNYDWSVGSTVVAKAGPLVSVSPETSSNYTILSQGDFCDMKFSLGLTVNPSPSALVSLPYTSNTICMGDKLTFSTALTETYQWYYNTALIPDATTKDFTPIASGNYSIKVTAANNCFTLSPAVPVTLNKLSFQELTGLSSLCKDGSLEMRVNNNFLNFAGTTNKTIQQNAGAENQVMNSFTVEAWVNPSETHEIDAASTNSVLGRTGQKYLVFPTKNTVPTGASIAGISVGTNGVSVYEQAPSNVPALLVWQGDLTGWNHIAVVYNNRVPSLYVNGQLVQTAGAGTYGSVYFGSYVGGWSSGGTVGYFKGGVKEYRIWKTVRTADEIKNNMKNQIALGNTNMAQYWKMNEGFGKIAYDYSGNNLNGALSELFWDKENDISYAWTGTPNFGLDQTTGSKVVATVPANATYTDYTMTMTSTTNLCSYKVLKTLTYSTSPGAGLALSKSSSLNEACIGEELKVTTTGKVVGWEKFGMPLNQSGASYITAVPGSYAVVVSNIDGTCLQRSQELLVNDGPMFTVSSDATVCRGNTIQLEAKNAYLNFTGTTSPAKMATFNWTGGPVTVEFWNKVELADLGPRCSISIGSADSPRLAISAPYGNNIYWDYGSISDMNKTRVSADYMPYFGKWTHVAMVSEGENGSFKAIYLDGKLVASSTSSDGAGNLIGLNIGSYQGSVHKGFMDELRIWNKVRTVQEIQSNMNKRIPGDSPNLVGYWAFDEASGTTLLDGATSYNRNAINYGATRAKDNIAYTWTPADGLSTTSGAIVSLSPTVKTVYSVKGTLNNGCTMNYIKIDVCKDILFFIPQDKTDAVVYEVSKPELNFYYKERYIDGIFSIKVYDYKKTELTLPASPAKKYGENYITLALPTDFPPGKIYTLEITGTKKDNQFLRFKYIPVVE